jgi:hypothetical protein
MGHYYPPDDPFNNPIVYELPEMIQIKNSHIIYMDERHRWLRIHSFIIYLEMHMDKFFETMNEIKLKQLFPIR